jgi:hypothetical protein
LSAIQQPRYPVGIESTAIFSGIPVNGRRLMALRQKATSGSGVLYQRPAGSHQPLLRVSQRPVANPSAPLSHLAIW